MKTHTPLLLALTLLAPFALPAVPARAADPSPHESTVGPAFAASSINTVIFRHSSLVTFNQTQYTAFYDKDAHVVLAKRTLPDGPWETKTTALTGNVKDAHNTIALGIDGAGILHMSWDHHANALNYVRTKSPGSLDLTDKLKTDGQRENQVTYPEFYNLPGGDLLFLYRVGTSGNGDLVLKRFHAADQSWSTIQQNLISGESKQNAYPEFCVGPDGTLHLGWVWRRTPDVATNHNICYAKSTDGGVTWTDSKGTKLALPITAATGEIAVPIPEKSELINQTTIAADANGHPYIATYYREPAQTVPQYHIVYHDGSAWRTTQVGTRTTPFTLAGGGTKRIPISRPLVLVDTSAGANQLKLLLAFRDIERGDKVSLAALNSLDDLAKNHWTITDLTPDSVGSWEPSADLTLWTRDHVLNLFVQKTDQLDGADTVTRTDNLPPTPVRVLEVKP